MMLVIKSKPGPSRRTPMEAIAEGADPFLEAKRRAENKKNQREFITKKMRRR